MTLPPPSTCGLPASFSAWRLNQPEAVRFALTSKKRARGLCAPVGFGKSLVGLTIARYLGGRYCYLTANKGLQDQLAVRDFSELLADIRGKGDNRYPCLMLADKGLQANCDQGPCIDGVDCSLRWTGCTYFDALRVAQLSQGVVPNYAKWLSFRDPLEDGIGEFNTLILDEAHDAADQLCSALTIELRGDEWTLRLLDVKRMPSKLDPEQWNQWARLKLSTVRPRYERLQTISKLSGGNGLKSEERTELYHLRRLVSDLQRLSTIDTNWIEYAVEGQGREADEVNFTPIWPTPYAEYLFRGVPNLVFMSASITQDDLIRLGAPAAELDFLELPSSFQAERCLFTWVPTITMKEPLSHDENLQWVRRADEILDSRDDRRVIVHTISFERQRFLLANSRHVGRMVWCDKRRRTGARSAEEAVDLFIKGRPDGVLVGPSFTTGWDFPYEACECQIVVKIPFLDTRDPLNAARCKDDRLHSPRSAMKKLVQIAGRPMRAEDDRGETIILDDQWRWFVKAYWYFAPLWFRQRWRNADRVPEAPEKLRRRAA